MDQAVEAQSTLLISGKLVPRRHLKTRFYFTAAKALPEKDGCVL